MRTRIHRGYFGSGDTIWATPGLIWVRGEDLGYTGVTLGEGSELGIHLGGGTGLGIHRGYFG